MWKQVCLRRHRRVSCFLTPRDFLVLSSDDDKDHKSENELVFCSINIAVGSSACIEEVIGVRETEGEKAKRYNLHCTR
ncbi:hypothetical protein MA16_Dca025244 [Dendrobium catenatum]|uniref:Uncharacterized protein n=1 Tax=Dendrobium catenatum TaxID=906689 RepID=A0A2I0XET2_9ASPA|nr:hypothetical protein MA16_Dca025244 [Dendrobium catenatum]